MMNRLRMFGGFEADLSLVLFFRMQQVDLPRKLSKTIKTTESQLGDFCKEIAILLYKGSTFEQRLKVASYIDI